MTEYEQLVAKLDAAIERAEIMVTTLRVCKESLLVSKAKLDALQELASGEQNNA
jgi:hypothetical protein